MEASRPLRRFVLCVALTIPLVGCELVEAIELVQTFTDPTFDDSVERMIDVFVNPTLDPVAGVLATTTPAAYAASAAMLAVDGQPVDGAYAAEACEDYPCMNVVEVELDDDVLPLRLGRSGYAQVAGRWKSRDQAAMTIRFIGMHVGIEAFPVRRITLVLARRNDDGQLVITLPILEASIGEEIDETLGPDPVKFLLDVIGSRTLDSDRIAIDSGMSAWVTRVDDADTPADLADDDYLLTGFGQVAMMDFESVVLVYQLMLQDVLIGPECTLNPIEGGGFLQDAGGSIVGDGGSTFNADGSVIDLTPAAGQSAFSFEAECDGKAKLEFSIGTRMGRMQQRIDIGL